MYREKMEFGDVCNVCFRRRSKKKKESYEAYSSCEDCRESEGSGFDD